MRILFRVSSGIALFSIAVLLGPPPLAADTAFVGYATRSDLQDFSSVISVNQTSTSSTKTGNYGSTTVAADLSTGDLKAQLDYSNLPVGGSAQATIGFGDSFQLNNFDGVSPFSLNLDLSGVFNTVGANFGNRSYISFYVVKPGQLQSVIDAGFPFSSSDYLDEFAWGIGPGALPFDDFPRPFTGSFDSFPANIVQPFNPGGNFDWYIILTLDASVDPPSTFGDIDADFSHTAGVSFDAPPGVTITSASGVFPGTASAVPEPSSVVLLTLGIAGLAFARRGKSSRRIP